MNKVLGSYGYIENLLSYGAVVLSFELKLMLTESLMHFGDCTFLTITNVNMAAVT